MKKNLICIFMLLFCFAGVALADKEDNQASPDRKDWTSNLEDTVLLCHVSIPGAHDAFTGATRSSGVTTQSLYVEEMFDRGVRFFDMRVGGCISKSNIWMAGYHNFFPLTVWFDNTMNLLYKRVEETKEFIIIEVARESGSPYWQTTWKQECAYFDRHNGENEVTRKFDYFKQYWPNKDHYEHIRDSILVPFRPDLRVGDVRGKIVYLINDDFSDKGKDMDVTKYWKDEYYADYPYINNQPGGPGGIGMFKLWSETQQKTIIHHYTAQNKDGVKNEPEKQKYIEEQFEYFNKQVHEHPDSCIWNFNYISGHEPFMWGIDKMSFPQEVAAYCNRRSAIFIGNHPDYYYGIVAMDWAAVATGWGYSMTGDALLDAVINSNWRYWKVKPEDRRNHYEVKTSFHGTHE